MYNVRRSLMTILTLAIAISMIAGLFYYFDAFERDALRSSSQFDMFADFTVSHNKNYQQVNCSAVFEMTDSSVIESFAATNLEVQNIYRYLTIGADRAYFYNEYEYFSLYTIIFDQNFYNSSRFSQFYKIVEGDTPQNQNEILIDHIVSIKMQIEVGSTIDLHTFYQPSYFEDPYFIDIPNITIVGTYIPQVAFEEYRIVNTTLDYETFYYGMTQEEIAELKTPADVSRLTLRARKVPVLSYSDFTNNSHPFQMYYGNVLDALNNTGAPYFYSLSGYGVNINRDFTSFFNIFPPDRSIAIEKNTLYRDLPSQVLLYDMISEPLQILFETSNRMRLLSQIINLPILIVALIVGSFASKSATQNKIDEFLLLRSKGVSKRMVRNQIFLEALVNGVVSSVLGSLLGFATFYGHDLWVRPMVYTQFVALEITLFAKQSSIIISIALGIILSLLTSISSMYYVSKLKTSELLTAIGTEEMDMEFDEQTIYMSTDKSSAELRKHVREEKREYKDAITEKQRKIQKWSILFITIGLLPVYYYIFMVFAERSNLYWLLSIAEFSISSIIYGFVSLLLIIVPIFLTVGIIRIFTKESPKFLARISRFLAKPFLKKKSYLLGLQMIKKKQYISVILLLGIFTSIFVHMNVMTYSLYSIDNMYENFQIGTDIQKSTTFSTNLTNSGDVELLIERLKSITTNEGDPLVEEALVVYRHRSSSYIQLFQYYVDLSSYVTMMLNADKMLPDKDFISKLVEVIEFNLQDPNGDGIPGAIVNERYLSSNSVSEGEIVFIDYRYYDSRLNILTAFTNGFYIPVRIVAVAEYFPGLYIRPVEESYLDPAEFIVIDVSALPFQGLDYMLHAPQMLSLVEIDMDLVEGDLDLVEEYLDNKTKSYSPFYVSDYHHYNHEWKSIQKDVSSSINPLLIYKMSYLIFIVVLIQVALGLPILLTSVRKKEHQFYGILMSRGIGKRGIFRFIMGELFVIYFFSIIGGALIGFLSSTLTLLLGQKMNPYSFGLRFRMFTNPIDLIVILSSVIGISLVIFLIEFLYDTRKSISEYLYKF